MEETIGGALLELEVCRWNSVVLLTLAAGVSVPAILFLF
jgi:hypothetical protein